MNHAMLKPELPWWRVPTMWLVIGGPALVMAASFATLFIALRSGDTPLPHAAASRVETLRPATEARNHAATPAR
jgi:hypothetical protein